MNRLTDESRGTSSRRSFIAKASALTVASLCGVSRGFAAEPPPETDRIRLLSGPAICMAPQYVAEDLLYAEGFRHVEYVDQTRFQGDMRGAQALAHGLADFTQWDAFATLPVLDAGDAVVVLAGTHAGCWELFVNGQIKALRDLRGKTVAIRGFGIGDHVLLSSMLAYVGMDPRKDVTWKAGPTVTDAIGLFVDGKADAYMAFAPQPHELRKNKIGRMILDTAQDRPWSQYFCCIAIARRDFVRSNPVATKRALRALLKATDLCAQQPDRVARMLVDRKLQSHYETAAEILNTLPYDRWRRAHPEDTLRFYSLRLHEVGMIKSTPDKLIAQGSDWRFLNELKKELKS